MTAKPAPSQANGNSAPSPRSQSGVGPAANLPIRGAPATPIASQGPLLQLLAATEAARRQLDAQVAEAEVALAQREAELATAQASLPAVESQLQVAQAKVTDGAIAVRQKEALISQLALAEASAEAAVKLKTTPVARPAAVGFTPKDELARGRQALTNAGRAKTEVVAALRRAEQSMEDARQRVADSRRAVANLAEELQQRRNALATLRQQLVAAVAMGDAANASALRALTAQGGERATPSPVAVADIPAEYLLLYRWHATSCPGLSWTVLAAIGSIESSHGRSTAPGVHSGENFAGAMGPMQFLGATWAAYGRDGNGDGTRDVYNPADAIAGAANYLCANGGGELARLASAIWNYNHADWYVASVIQLAAAYGGRGLQAPTASAVSAAQLVGNPNLTLSPEARSDILTGIVDPRVVQLLASVAAQHRVSVSVLKTGHHKFVRGTDRVSNHYACDDCPGRALDIYEVDGAPVNASNVAALQLALSILTADPPLRPDEFGSPWPELSRFPGGFSDGDHQGHLHIGWPAN